MRQSLLNKAFAVSLLAHAGFVGLLALEASRRSLTSDAPMRVRILSPPASQGTGPVAPQPPPAVRTRPEAGRGPIETSRPGSQMAMPQPSTERLAPRPTPVPDTPAAPAPTPQVVAPTLPQVALPPAEKPEPLREARVPAPPERSGLRLGGPPEAAPLPRSKETPSSSVPSRPSLRDQIASLGSGLRGDLGGPAKRTVSLDSREERFLDYLSMVKRRVERIWEYPEEARNHGVGGEVYLEFTLNTAGSLVYIRLVRSSGYPILDEEALRAVKVAAPYDPFFPQMGDQPMNILATFHYNQPYRFRRN
jgi:TonB family protein